MQRCRGFQEALKPRREILQQPGEANQARQALWAEEGRHVYAGLSGRHNSKSLVTPGHGMYSVKGKNEMLPMLWSRLLI